VAALGRVCRPRGAHRRSARQQPARRGGSRLPLAACLPLCTRARRSPHSLCAHGAARQQRTRAALPLAHAASSATTLRRGCFLCAVVPFRTAQLTSDVVGKETLAP
jgi:hypothetical protein